jgi:hypothetical protein
MSRHSHHRPIAAGAVAVAALLALHPASAASSIAIQTAAHTRGCLHSQASENCRSYPHRHIITPQDDFWRPGIGYYYRYRFEPPEGNNGPYYGYQPYNGYESSFGFSF